MTPDQATTLTCPKCAADMRSYERNGIVVDQCTGCRGIFLDRGELERLIDAESVHYGDSRPAGGDDRERSRDDRESSRDDRERSRDDREREHDDDRGHGKRRKKKSFLSDLLEFGE